MVKGWLCFLSKIRQVNLYAYIFRFFLSSPLSGHAIMSSISTIMIRKAITERRIL